MQNAIQLVDDWYQLSRDLSQRIVQFSRAHRYSLGRDLECCARGLQADLIRIQYTPRGPLKLQNLQRVNVEIEILRYLIRLAHDMQQLSIMRFSNQPCAGGSKIMRY